MATITTSWTTIASKTWKSGSFNVKFLLQARLISQSVANNSSVIQTRLRSERSSYSFGGWPYKFTCSYCTSKSGDSTWTIETENILVSPNKTANHNADGTKSLSLSATAVITGLGMNVSLSGTATLPRINRIADLTSWPSFNDETNPIVKFTNPANYRVNMRFDIYVNGIVGYVYENSMHRYTSPYTIDLTDYWDEIRQECTNAKSYDCYVFLTTYDANGDDIGFERYERTFSIVNANPTFDATYQDINSTTTSITGDNQKIIRNQSNLQINISNAEGKKYATLSSVKAVINGITYNGTLSGTTGTIPVGTIDVSENIVAAVTLTDSRGYTTTNNIEIQVLNWELPTANISLARQNNYYSETDIKVDANYSSLDGDNVITIKERHKKTSEQNYSAYTTLADNVTSTITLDNLYEWDVQVLVQDLFGSTTYNLTLDKGMPIIYFDRIKRSVSINCFPANNESLEVESSLYLNNQNIEEYIYDTGWQTITPTNGTAGTGYYVPQYRRVGKLVTMRGYITTRNTTAMFNLPDGYRPSARLTFAGTNDNRNVNEIRITEAGDVRLLGTTGTLSSGVPCFLDNISYFID